jgi:hypothetical protein
MAGTPGFCNHKPVAEGDELWTSNIAKRNDYACNWKFVAFSDRVGWFLFPGVSLQLNPRL